MARPLQIRHKLMLGLGLVVGIIAMLLSGTLYGLLSQEATMKTVDSKLIELVEVGNLRTAVGRLAGGPWGVGQEREEQEFRNRLKAVRTDLDNYRSRLQESIEHKRDPDKGANETGYIQAIEQCMADLDAAITKVTGNSAQSGPGGATQAISSHKEVSTAVIALINAVNDLQSVIFEDQFQRIADSKTDSKYSRIVVIATSVIGIVLMVCLLWSFYGWVFNPVRELHDGAKRLGEGDFDNPIHLHSGDEMEDLANAFNTMRSQLREIYQDLERKVNERSRQLVRSERLASVGFLAAGVAHEINNPLQAITLYSGALDARLNDLARRRPSDAADMEVLCRYLKTILEEAFRCKRITERLLEFSRGGDSPREQVELCGLIESVVQVAKPLQSAQGKEIVFQGPAKVWAFVNSDEIKSVVLNLVVNALDSMDEGGTLTIQAAQKMGEVELAFHDTGCGMTGEVLENIFEPFYTQSRGGRGTGLGLTISHRIITQHGGQIEAASAGPDQGSTFTVRLPLQTAETAEPVARPRLAA